MRLVAKTLSGECSIRRGAPSFPALHAPRERASQKTDSWPGLVVQYSQSLEDSGPGQDPVSFDMGVSFDSIRHNRAKRTGLFWQLPVIVVSGLAFRVGDRGSNPHGDATITH